MLKNRPGSLILCLCLALASLQVTAAIEHISLNKLQFIQGESVDMRINLVAEPKDIQRLEFVLWQQSGSEKLMVQPVGSYMLQLLGFEPVTDPNAYIAVRVHVIDNWQPLTRLALFRNATELPDYTNLMTAARDEIAIANEIQSDQKRSSGDPGAQNCTIVYQPQETLWRIGTRYAKQWNTNVYSAMLAIFEANQNSFKSNNINLLMSGSVLDCPMENAWLQFGNAAQAKQKFSQLSQR